MTDSPDRLVALEPVGKWAEVLAQTRQSGRSIEPFEVVEGLTLYPPTPERARQIKVASWSHTAATAAAVNAANNGAEQAEVDRIRKQLEDAEIAYNEALFGRDEYPRVIEYFESRGDWERDAFVDAVKEQFLRLPPDGKCPTCKVVIAPEQAGNGDASSGTSNVIGMTSKPTSPSSSGDATPGTGAAG